MNLYDGLATLYDELFPPNPEATAFILDLARKGSRSSLPARVLDIGCATASLLLDLAAEGWEACGIEPSEAMRKVAESRAELADLGLTVADGTMLDAAGLFPAAHFGLLLCLGNTLPYLASEAELGTFLEGAASLLAPGGSIVIQVLNYQRVLGENGSKGWTFPELHAGKHAFRRRYENAPDGRLAFITEISHGEKRPVVSRDLLTPFKPAIIESALSAAGFAGTALRPGWAPEAAEFSPAADSYLILTARRAP